MEMERLFLLCGIGSEGQIAASYIGLCERCVVLDGAETLRVYRDVATMHPQLLDCGVGDTSTIVCHHDGAEVRYSAGVDLRRLAFLAWRTRVDYRAATDLGYRWH